MYCVNNRFIEFEPVINVKKPNFYKQVSLKSIAINSS